MADAGLSESCFEAHRPLTNLSIDSVIADRVN
jgi:hypothetical protein